MWASRPYVVFLFRDSGLPFQAISRARCLFWSKIAKLWQEWLSFRREVYRRLMTIDIANALLPTVVLLLCFVDLLWRCRSSVCCWNCFCNMKDVYLHTIVFDEKPSLFFDRLHFPSFVWTGEKRAICWLTSPISAAMGHARLSSTRFVLAPL